MFVVLRTTNKKYMDIKVLGTGCKACNMLYDTVKQAVAELNLDATVEKEEDMIKMMAYNVLSLPGLVVNGKLISQGKKLSVADVKTILSGL